MSKRFSTKSRADQIAAQLKAAQDAQREYEKSIDEALKHAGRARVEFVETLYDHFGIEPETTERMKDGEVVRDKNGEAVRVRTDKSEAVRIEKLAAAFGKLVEQAVSARSHVTAQPAAACESSSERFGAA